MPRDDDRFPISRRRFNALTGAAGLALGIVPTLVGRALAKASMTADQIIHGKSADMIIHNAKLGVTETPIGTRRRDCRRRRWSKTGPSGLTDWYSGPVP